MVGSSIRCEKERHYRNGALRSASASEIFSGTNQRELSILRVRGYARVIFQLDCESEPMACFVHLRVHARIGLACCQSVSTTFAKHSHDWQNKKMALGACPLLNETSRAWAIARIRVACITSV